MPPPYNPVHGQFAPVGPQVDLTRVCAFQIKEVHDNFLVCRGYDGDSRQFLNEVRVAKPFTLRAKRIVNGEVVNGEEAPSPNPAYTKGDIIYAAKVRSKFRDNPCQPTGETDDDDFPELEAMKTDEEDAISFVDLNVDGRNAATSYSLVVTVRNDGADDWGQWDIVGVQEPFLEADDGDLDPYTTDNPPPPVHGLVYSGARLDEVVNGRTPCVSAGGNAHLGITQEPIKAGEIGRVCIRGATFVLVQEAPSGTSNYAERAWGHVRKDSGRWTVRNGPAGDMRLLQRIHDDPYEDGTYDDQCLYLADLCDVPNRVVIWNLTGAALPPCSIVSKSSGVPHTHKLGATTSSYNVYTYGLCASCAWEIPENGYGYGYRIQQETPVLASWALDAQQPSVGDYCGVAGGDLKTWKGLPGLRVVLRDWYVGGTPPYRAWMIRDPHSAFYAKAGAAPYTVTQLTATACTGDGTIVFDGTEQAGITYPAVQAPFRIPSYQATGFVHARQVNIQANQIVRCTEPPGNIGGDGFYCGEEVLDDPIGTVKLWIGEAGRIPGGWREYDGLQGRFPVGYLSGDADFGIAGGAGGTRSHAHGAAGNAEVGIAVGATETHLPPYRVVRFIERYQ